MLKTSHRRVDQVRAANTRVWEFYTQSTYGQQRGRDDICDFTFGNPNEMPLPAFTDTLHRWTDPQDKNWFAYKASEDHAREAVASILRERRGLAYAPEDIAMTNGAVGAIATALMTFLEPGDEVIINLPPWFNYESMILLAGGQPVKVPVKRDTFDLDLNAIAAAITPKTRMIIVNSPNNPTGRIYPKETLEDLAEILRAAEAKNGGPIYLLSDEPYNQLVFDGNPFISPAAFHPRSMVAYSFGKVLLTPGERLGYLALVPDFPDKPYWRDCIAAVQVSAGWLFPNGILQYATEDLEKLSIDVSHLQAKRDRMVAALRGFGYDVHAPEGTFYLFPRSPIADDIAFCRELERDRVFVIPGELFETPGYFRICLTATEEMIDTALPSFERAIAAVTKGAA